jgi:hypothetical protein
VLANLAPLATQSAISAAIDSAQAQRLLEEASAVTSLSSSCPHAGDTRDSGAPCRLGSCRHYAWSVHGRRGCDLVIYLAELRIFLWPDFLNCIIFTICLLFVSSCDYFLFDLDLISCVLSGKALNFIEGIIEETHVHH